MSSSKQFARKVAKVVRTEGNALGGGDSDPVQYLQQTTGMYPRQIVGGIEHLEKCDKAVVERNGGKISRILYVGHSGYDRCERSVGDKKARMFAKGVPPVLPDELCSEVTVSYMPGFGPDGKIEETETSMEAHETDCGYDEAVRARCDELNLALLALRDSADKNGRIASNSCARLIKEKLGCGSSYASKLNYELGKLGVRHTENIGGGKYIHVLVMSVEELTAAQVANLMCADEVTRPQTEKETKVPVQNDLQDAPMEEVSCILPSDDVTTRLLEIIEQLESAAAERDGVIVTCDNRITTLERSLSELEEANANLQREVDSYRALAEQRQATILELNSENARLGGQLEELQGDLDGCRRQLSVHSSAHPRVAAVLKKYDK